jgi:hypothetical protein
MDNKVQEEAVKMKWSDILEVHGDKAEKMLAAARAGKDTEPAPFTGNTEEDTEEYGRWWRIYGASGEMVYEEYECPGLLPGGPDDEEPAVFVEEIEFD